MFIPTLQFDCLAYVRGACWMERVDAGGRGAAPLGSVFEAGPALASWARVALAGLARWPWLPGREVAGWPWWLQSWWLEPRPPA